mmetsp:Transcript_141561/g.368950  ORF Transcript_141561/g.368950 Transcript_141561/m.368950 type:complete len:211 (+) Transcript_141561:627-1259(+)
MMVAAAAASASVALAASSCHGHSGALLRWRPWTNRCETLSTMALAMTAAALRTPHLLPKSAMPIAMAAAAPPTTRLLPPPQFAKPIAMAAVAMLMTPLLLPWRHVEAWRQQQLRRRSSDRSAGRNYPTPKAGSLLGAFVKTQTQAAHGVVKQFCQPPQTTLMRPKTPKEGKRRPRSSQCREGPLATPRPPVGWEVGSEGSLRNLPRLARH